MTQWGPFAKDNKANHHKSYITSNNKKIGVNVVGLVKRF